MFKKLIASILSVLSVILTYLGIAHHPMGPQADMSKFTLTFSIPGNSPTLFSTCEEQAEQVMPVMLNFCFTLVPAFLSG